MLSQMARITTRQINIAVQDVQDAFAYAIHEVFLQLGTLSLCSLRSAVLVGEKRDNLI